MNQDLVANRPRLIQELSEFLAIPSVSALPTQRPIAGAQPNG